MPRPPLSFRQKMQLEHYLVTVQEWIISPDNEELKELVEERSKEVLKFLTQLQLAEIESEVLLTADELKPTREDIELPNVLLPTGLRAEDMEVIITSTQYDRKQRTVHLSIVIQPQPPEGGLEDL